MVLFLHMNFISQARLDLALFLVAFKRETLVVLCCGENGTPFCLAELSSCTNTRVKD